MYNKGMTLSLKHFKQPFHWHAEKNALRVPAIYFCTVNYLWQWKPMYLLSFSQLKCMGEKKSLIMSKTATSDHRVVEIERECVKWQTVRRPRVENLDSLDLCVYVRTRGCTTAAVSVAEQELMRRVSDRAACLCQQGVEDRLVGSSTSERSQVKSEGERDLEAAVDGKCQILVRRKSLISTQTALRLGDDPCHVLRWHAEQKNK